MNDDPTRPASAQDATLTVASTAVNKARVRRVFDEGVNANAPDVVDELYAPDFVDRSAFPDQTLGPEGIKQAIADFRALLPDVHVTVDAIVAEGTLVATRETWRGTDPATGQQVTGTTLHHGHEAATGYPLPVASSSSHKRSFLRQ